MKTLAIKAALFLICVLPCFFAVKKSFESQKLQYEEYISKIEACSETQKTIERAIDNYGSGKPIFKCVKSDDDYEEVEQKLINSGYLDKNLLKAKPDCFFVINDGKVTCGCHSDVEQIKENIESAKRIMNKSENNEYFQYFFVIMGAIFLFGGFWGF